MPKRESGDVKEYKNDRLLRLPEILEIIPISRSSWYAGVKAGLYPKPIYLGPRTRAWRESDIDRLVQVGISQDKQRGA